MIRLDIPNEVKIMVSVDGGIPERALGLLWRFEERMIHVVCEKTSGNPGLSSRVQVVAVESSSSANVKEHASLTEGERRKSAEEELP